MKANAGTIKFALKLELPRKMLQALEDTKGAIHDTDMLNKVVKDMLAKSHRIDAWMNERTQIM